MALRNIKVAADKDFLVIRINMKGAGVSSASGKNLVIATTGGNIPVEVTGAPAGLRLGLNLYVPNEG